MGILILLIFSSTAFAHAPQDGDVYLSVMPEFIIPRPGHYEGLNTPYQGGLGFKAEGDLDKNGGVEVGIIYLPYISSIDQNGQVITQKIYRVHISTGYRYWFNPRISAFLGFFSAYSTGEPVTIQNDFAPQVPNTSAGDSTEYGFDATFQVEPIHFGRRFSLVADVRYAHSVTPKAHEDEDFASISVGLKFFLQSREEDVRK